MPRKALMLPDACWHACQRKTLFKLRQEEVAILRVGEEGKDRGEGCPNAWECVLTVGKSGPELSLRLGRGQKGL